MVWWKQNRMRLIQTNLRDTDANLDAGRLIEDLKNLSANVLQVNTGGLMAFYPTELEYHYKSPYLHKDLIGELVEQCHKQDIRVIARFDFSKAHESIWEKKPEWFYRSPNGTNINYNGMVHTCVNGGFQSEYSLKIIEEVLTRYPVDGIFFNMFGYQTRDYSGRYYGICHCDNCRKKFMDRYHMELPSAEDVDDPVYHMYVEFQKETTREQLDRIHGLVKGICPDLPISTYADYKIDMIRKESNTAVDRPYPIWQYSASENVKSVEDTWEDKVISNCCINAVDIPYRFMGVSKYLVRQRLYQSIANGSGLDFCINGVFADYPDKDNLDTVREVFEYHKRNEQYYGCLKSAADVALIKPAEKSLSDGKKEYAGIFKMLKEQHILFDVICQENLENRVADLGRYHCVVVPDYCILAGSSMEEAVLNPVTNWILTGSFPCSSADPFYRLTGGRLVEKREHNRSAYMDVKNKNIFSRFPKRDWVFLDKSFACMDFAADQMKLLPYIAPARFGPPERCGGFESTKYYGAGIRMAGESKVVSIPWEIGALYEKYGYEDHKYLLMDMMDYVTEGSYTLTTNAPMDTELFFNRYEDGTFLLQLLNGAGYNGSTFYEAHPVSHVDICIHGLKNGFQALCLDGSQDVSYENHDDVLTVHIECLKNYKAMHLIPLLP